ncbi:MAG: hypothetical protein GOVbin703_141 [Prokaryotic dsDNA virus sp.]|nr:MAG: hypothetical protein GOVbin703_141 [Prokaryotic dsDNA virus sp.]|tara:strand:+ start:535 stop:699 length:165 start_codon:yes stop_codon:yes gene_type:complete
MKFLASKELSLFCFAVNCLFAGAALLAKDATWFLISTCLAAVCYHNYRTALERE